VFVEKRHQEAERFASANALIAGVGGMAMLGCG
jgi:hypothetical protein